MDTIGTDLDHGKLGIGAYLNLSKAFDTLDHTILSVKLQNYRPSSKFHAILFACDTSLTITLCPFNVNIDRNRLQSYSNWIQIIDFSAPVTLKYDGLPLKKVPILCYVKFCASFQTEFKLELQSGNGQFGSKLAIFCPV